MKIEEIRNNGNSNGSATVIKSIINGLNGLTHNQYVNPCENKKRSTKEVKTCLCEIGCREKFYTAASDMEDKDKDFPEWLYDVVWLKYADDDPQKPLVKIPLAAECEWGNRGDIKDDFDKLIQSTADVRLMIFNGTKHDSEKTANCLSTLVNQYNQEQQRNARYLFTSWEWKESQDNKWHFKHFIFRPDKNFLKKVPPISGVHRS